MPKQFTRITRITFEDKGQDFLWWDIADNHVIDCGPFQKTVWNGSRILDAYPMIGKQINIKVGVVDDSWNTTIKYLVIDIQDRVEEIDMEAIKAACKFWV